MNVGIPEFFYYVGSLATRGPDLYREWAREKLRDGDVILTFNYDLACERALKAEERWEIGDGYGFSLGAGITPHSKTKVFKLHGSTNWLGILFEGKMGFSQTSNVYGPRPCLFGERYFSYLGYSGDVHDPACGGISEPAGEPALILPTLHKNFFHQTSFGHEWKHFWDCIWGQAQSSICTAKKIVVIGYSMPAADERARELLLKYLNSDAEILVYSGSRTNDICEHFRKCGFRDVKSSGQGYFEDYLNT